MSYLKKDSRFLIETPGEIRTPIDLLRRVFWKLISPLPDRQFISLKYWSIFGRFPNLDTPKLFTEKLQARKLNDRDIRYGAMVDKHAVKHFVANHVGKEYVVPTYWVGTDLSQVAWQDLNFPMIIKPTHASGLGKILYGLEDVEALQDDKLGPLWLKIRHYRYNREWAYSQVSPQLLIEKLLLDKGELPTTYRFYVFHGKVALIDVDFKRNGVAYASVRDPSWAHVPVVDKACDHIDVPELPEPPRFAEMKELASRLGSTFDFVRVDFYASEDWVKFSELTLYPSGGLEIFDPPEFDALLGKHWEDARRDFSEGSVENRRNATFRWASISLNTHCGSKGWTTAEEPIVLDMSKSENTA